MSTSAARRRTPEAVELVGHVGLGRAVVDEDRALGNLEQDPVALADVQEGHAQPGGRSRGGAVAGDPHAPADDEGDDHQAEGDDP